MSSGNMTDNSVNYYHVTFSIGGIDFGYFGWFFHFPNYL